MPVFNKIKLGVRSKIFTASLVIALMLLLSGALAFFELGRMSRYISDFISNSILSVDLTRNLLNTSERYHSGPAGDHPGRGVRGGYGAAL